MTTLQTSEVEVTLVTMQDLEILFGERS